MNFYRICSLYSYYLIKQSDSQKCSWNFFSP